MSTSIHVCTRAVLCGSENCLWHFHESQKTYHPEQANRLLCSLHPHAIAPQDENSEVAVAKHMCFVSMCKKNYTIAPPAQRQPVTLDVQRCREGTSVRDVLLRINEYIDGGFLDPLPCAVIPAALPEVVRRHDHGALIDMQSVAPIVALRLCHLNGSWACLKQSSVGAHQILIAFIKNHGLEVAALPVSQVRRGDVFCIGLSDSYRNQTTARHVRFFDSTGFFVH
jgi:hypothetical protein